MANLQTIIFLITFFIFIGQINMSADAREKRLKLTSTDEETGTKFSIIDESGGLPGTDPCKGGYGDLEVIGEVPSNISLADDTVAQALVEKGKDAATKACPRFSIGGSAELYLWLFKGEYNEKAKYEVYAHWKKPYPSEPMSKKYRNLTFERTPEHIQFEQSPIVFSLIKCSESPDGRAIIFRTVRGDLSKEINLSNEAKARQLLEKAAQFAQRKCPVKYPFAGLEVYLYQSDEKLHGQYKDNWVVKSANKTCKFSYCGDKYKQLAWDEYVNRPVIEAQKKLEAEKKRREMQARLAKEAREKAEVRKRYDEFVKKYGVKEWPSSDALSANPFVYEGKTVAIVLKFTEMLSPAQGLFMEDSQSFVVSNIPKGLFTTEKKVVLAGHVLGKTEVKLPLFGPVSVPHLKFVGVHFCGKWNCSDIIRE